MSGIFTEQMILDLYKDSKQRKKFDKHPIKGPQIEFFKEALFTEFLNNAFAEYDVRENSASKPPKALKVEMPSQVIRPEAKKSTPASAIAVITRHGILPCR